MAKITLEKHKLGLHIPAEVIAELVKKYVDENFPNMEISLIQPKLDTRFDETNFDGFTASLENIQDGE